MERRRRSDAQDLAQGTGATTSLLAGVALAAPQGGGLSVGLVAQVAAREAGGEIGSVQEPLNSEVRIGVVDVASGETRWRDPGTDAEHYVPWIYWTSDPNILVVTINPVQNQLQLVFFDVRDGRA